ncbi:GntR family transcriptional regulator [Actinomadura rupiterrae]|uniref:GntR family transcriptional regulator n=1 Tax=Actinomadura rupiterrae TaxID=559627 RepID=UPI0020A38EA7|nr:GntR family transcriptional regulator [Actinomadura rupiterrae]MCP2343377.1 GntR family transcriptional regulator [Actinomadura rupiterrae]
MRSEPATGVLPVHHQIANDLRERIQSGELQPGARLPTIGDLQRDWGCSDGVVREALAVLRSEGLIASSRGKASTVRVPPTRIKLRTGFAQEQKDLVLRPRAERAKRGAIEMISGVPIEEVISTHRYEVVAANPDLSEEFGIAEGGELLRRTYEMTDPKTRHRLSFSISYIPLELIRDNPALLDEENEPWPGGHLHQLYTVGIEVGKFIRSVIAEQPTVGDRQRWGMDEGVPMLRVRTRSIDINDRVVELSDAWYPADRTELVYAEKLARWPADHNRFDIKKGDR